MSMKSRQCKEAMRSRSVNCRRGKDDKKIRRSWHCPFMSYFVAMSPRKIGHKFLSNILRNTKLDRIYMYMLFHEISLNVWNFAKFHGTCRNIAKNNENFAQNNEFCHHQILWIVLVNLARLEIRKNWWETLTVPYYCRTESATLLVVHWRLFAI